MSIQTDGIIYADDLWFQDLCIVTNILRVWPWECLAEGHALYVGIIMSPRHCMAPKGNHWITYSGTYIKVLRQSEPIVSLDFIPSL